MEKNRIKLYDGKAFGVKVSNYGLENGEENMNSDYVTDEPLILEPDNFTDDEWETILKVFGMAFAERIVIEASTVYY